MDGMRCVRPIHMDHLEHYCPMEINKKIKKNKMSFYIVFSSHAKAVKRNLYN